MRVPDCVVSWPLNHVPAGSNKLLSQEEQRCSTHRAARNQNTVYVFGVKITSGFLKLVPAASSGRLMTRKKGEHLLLLPEIADRSGSTNGALPFIGRMSV
jgi:hypothetical protein